MKDYSPYENIRAKPYPAIYLTAGIKDSRVKYYEPLKFAARLRKFKQNQYHGLKCESTQKSDVKGTPLLIRVTDYGHFGGSGQEMHKETALWQAFVLENFGLA
jgi:oligopeptidase B